MFMSKDYKIIADDTLKLLEQGYYYNQKNKKIEIAELVQYSVDNTALYTPDQLESLLSLPVSKNGSNTNFEVANQTTLVAARRLADEGQNDILCLSFASAKNEGGGFIRGAVAQEESIARASGLYPCLLKAPDYYNFHRNQKDFLYSDHMIWSPRVPVFKDENGNVTDEVLCVGIVTSAAVNAGELHRINSPKIGMIEEVMRVRIEKLLALCAEKKHPVLILGAWGCGVFRNDPEMIADLFHEALTRKFANCFKRIVFAVKTNKESMIKPFRRRFLTM
jgi:uncharacterized protein (TIGR02452 family)